VVGLVPYGTRALEHLFVLSHIYPSFEAQSLEVLQAVGTGGKLGPGGRLGLAGLVNIILTTYTIIAINIIIIIICFQLKNFQLKKLVFTGAILFG